MIDINDMYHMKRKSKDEQTNLSFEHYKLAAEKGDVQAMYEMACCFNYGNGVEQDLTYATTWLNKAAANEHKEALEAMDNCKKTPRSREKYTLFGVEFFTDCYEKFRSRCVVMPGYMLYAMGFNHFENNDSYYKVQQLSDGMHVIGSQCSYYPPDEDGFGEECTFTYGYYDKNFCPVIDFKYDQALPFYKGKAKVKDSSGIYYINKKGEKV